MHCCTIHHMGVQRCSKSENGVQQKRVLHRAGLP